MSMQSEPPLTLILSPLRAGRGEGERTFLGSLFGDPGTVPPKGSPLPLEKGKGQGEGSSRLHGCGSMLATAAMATGAVVEILLFWHAAQLKRFGDKLADRFLYGLHGLLRFGEALCDGAVKEGLAPLFEIGNLRHIERHACLLLVLQHRAAVAQLLVLHFDAFVRQKGVHLPADHWKVGLVENGLAEFPRLLQDR